MQQHTANNAESETSIRTSHRHLIRLSADWSNTFMTWDCTLFRPGYRPYLLILETPNEAGHKYWRTGVQIRSREGDHTTKILFFLESGEDPDNYGTGCPYLHQRVCSRLRVEPCRDLYSRRAQWFGNGEKPETTEMAEPTGFRSSKTFYWIKMLSKQLLFHSNTPDIHDGKKFYFFT